MSLIVLSHMLRGLERRVDSMSIGMDAGQAGGDLEGLSDTLRGDMDFFGGDAQFFGDVLNLGRSVARYHPASLNGLFRYISDLDPFRSEMLIAFHRPMGHAHPGHAHPGHAHPPLLVCAVLVRSGQNVQWLNHRNAGMRVVEEPMKWAGGERVVFQLEAAAGHCKLVDMPDARWAEGRRRLSLDDMGSSIDLSGLLKRGREMDGRLILFKTRLLRRILIPPRGFTINKKEYRMGSIYVRDTGREGLGVFAAADLDKDAVVCTYYGRMFSHERLGRNPGELTHVKALSLYGSAFVEGSVSGSHMDGSIQPEADLTLEAYVDRIAVGSFLNSAGATEANCQMVVVPGSCDDLGKRYVPFDPLRPAGVGEKVFALLMKLKRRVRAGEQLRWDYRCDAHPSAVPPLEMDEEYRDGLARGALDPLDYTNGVD
jgi:hypothetical protein